MFDLPLGRRMHIYKQSLLYCMLGRDMKSNAHSMLRTRVSLLVFQQPYHQNVSKTCAVLWLG